MIISLFYRIKNRIKKAKPATRAGYRGIRADLTKCEPSPIPLSLNILQKTKMQNVRINTLDLNRTF
jgi:hypothetical protein